ncbi:fimbrial protein [Providencia rettgeri]|uniref:P pilus assembly protein, pilin FimA n=2 Tax=Providencia rettgeri TaxID=587 RepID=A0A9N8GZD5_PRORE|nr:MULTISPECIES: fimbrial protein [Providencia]MBO2880082.1 type 1 fimbrial protein [Providencia rettgeri]MBO2887042.1 type 1 fimbrial protein [Providencia rettgeri]CAB5692136.1 P pilus assembly protein, pilin FimA [Providencia rettgeri]CAB5694423.1 P pilus assembly protein, pilin FimA [Providencia rettgeri]CAC9181278.1 P pilus assembly protein, pilin FimA [Providencia rettgeri]
MKRIMKLSILLTAFFASNLIAKPTQLQVDVNGTFNIDTPPCSLESNNTESIHFGELDYNSLLQTQYTSQKKPLNIVLKCHTPAKMSVYATGQNVSGVDNIFKTTHPSIGVFIEDALGEKLNGITKPRAAALPQPGSMTFALKAGLMKTGNEEMKTGSFSYNVAVVIDVTHF